MTRPQDLVELALAAVAAVPGAQGVVLVEETAEVNLRWALNSLTTNGVGTGQSVSVVLAVPVAGDTGAGGTGVGGTGVGDTGAGGTGVGDTGAGGTGVGGTGIGGTGIGGTGIGGTGIGGTGIGGRGVGGMGVGAVTRRGVGADDVAGIVAQALAAASSAPPAEDAAPLPAGTVSADWDEGAVPTGPGTLAPFSAALGEVLARSAGAGRESFGFARHAVATTWLGTSSGARLRTYQPDGTVEINGKSHARTRSTYVARATRDFSDVDVLALDDEITRRLGWQARRIELGPGRYDTVLPPTAVADLMIPLLWAADARSAHEGRSAFSGPGGGTRVGERLTDVPLTLTSDPSAAGLECSDHVETTSSSPFASVFDNGIGVPAATWLDDGVLAALPSTRHTAALTGLPFTPVAGNLLLHAGHGAGSVEDLSADLERGLLVTSLWYLREVDARTLLYTGLTRDGVYLVEGGEVTGAVTNFRFNESPVDVLRRVQAAGSTEITLSREWCEYFSRTAMPALRIGDFHMSTVSPAS